MNPMKIVHCAAFLLVIAGGLNWLLIGLPIDWELSQLVGGADGTIARAIAVIIGLAAIFELVTHKKSCKSCEKGGSSSSAAPQMPAQ
jgi:uncharacterized protein